MNFNSDPISFANDFSKKFSSEIEEMVDVLFIRSVHEANKGLHHSAIADAQFTLLLLQYSPGDSCAYIMGFLTQLYIDLDDIPKALLWWKRGWERIDRNDPSYKDLVDSYNYLDDLLNGENWKAV